MRRSSSSPMRASISRSSLDESVRKVCSTLMICSSVSLIWPCARAICATSAPHSPFSLVRSRCAARVRVTGTRSFLRMPSRRSSSSFISSTSWSLASRCAVRPLISCLSWPTRSLSWAIWPFMAVWRASNSRFSPCAMSAASSLILAKSAGKRMAADRSRSASRRALRATSCTSCEATMPRLARACVSSRLTRMSPAVTRSPFLT